MCLYHKVNLHVGYFPQLQKGFALLKRLATIFPPSCGHFKPVERGFVFLHSGYCEQARNLPYLPTFITIGEAHFSHFSSVTWVIFSEPGSLCSVSSVRSGFVFLHCGNPEHAKNLPCLPHRMTMGRPHFSHFKSVGMSSGLIFPLVFSTSARSLLKGV